MSRFYSYSRTEPIVINEDIDFFSNLFFDNVKKRLKKSYIFHNKQEGRQLEFKGSIFRFIWNAWDVFNPISKGKIRFLTIDKMPHIMYEISFTEILFLALVFHLIPIFSLKYETTISLIMIGVIWLLYLINYLVASIRFRGYIAKTMIEVNQISSYLNNTEA